MLTLKSEADTRSDIKKKAVAGFIFLSFRRIVLYVSAFVTNIFLSRNLSPSDFGVFGILTYFITCILLVNDLGLNSVVVQRKQNITEEEKNAIFTMQVLIFFIGGIILISVFPFLERHYFSGNHAFFFPLLVLLIGALCNIASSLPTAFLIRNLSFHKFSTADIASTIGYQIVAIILAFSHAGIWTLVIGFVTLNAIKLLLVWKFSEFSVRLDFGFSKLLKMLRLGFSYQFSSVVNFLKDSFTPLIIGSYSGVYAVGLLDWTKNVVTLPALVTDSFGQIAFPAYARFQDDKEYLGKIITDSIKLITFFTFPMAIFIAVFSKDLIQFFYSNKWSPALPLLYLFTIGAISTGIAAPLYQGILALGKSSSIIALSILLLLLEWSLNLIMLLRFGYIGVAIASAPIAWLFVIACIVILHQSHVRIRIVDACFKNILITLVTYSVILLLRHSLVVSFGTFLLSAIATGSIYSVLSLLFNIEPIRHMMELRRNK